MVPTANLAADPLTPLGSIGVTYSPIQDLNIGIAGGFLFKPEQPFLSGSLGIDFNNILVSGQVDWDENRNFEAWSTTYQLPGVQFGLASESLKLNGKPRNTIIGPKLNLQLNTNTKVSLTLGARIIGTQTDFGSLVKLIIKP